MVKEIRKLLCALLALLLIAAGICAAAEEAETPVVLDDALVTSDRWMFQTDVGGYMIFYPNGTGNTGSGKILGDDLNWEVSDSGLEVRWIKDGAEQTIVYELRVEGEVPVLVNTQNEAVKLVRDQDLDRYQGTDASAAADAPAASEDAAASEAPAAAESEPYVREVVLPANDYVVLSEGSRGEEARALQQALIDQGFLDGGADGIFGRGTAAAVMAFQQSVGLPATGIADVATQRKLFGDDEDETITITLTGTWKTDHMQVEGLFVDESFVSDTSPDLTMLYIFYTASTQDENLKLYSKDAVLTVNGTNSYTSAHSMGAGRYMPNYYYSNYVENVYVGGSLKVMETVMVPKGELTPGRTLTFSKSAVPDSKAISLMTDDIVFCADNQKIARIIDPDGYAKAVYALTEADSDTKARVKKAINNYYWTFYVNNISYKIEFSGDSYTLSTSLGTTTKGSYTVLNGYVRITNSTTDAINYIPYTWGATDIDLDVVAGFDLNEW